MSEPLPSALSAIESLDAALYEAVSADFRRLARAGQAVAWAQERLPPLIASPSTADVLGLLVDEARALTGAPTVWAVTWTGDLERGRASFEAFAGDEGPVPPPAAVSGSVIARAAREGRAVWSDDAAADARFASAQSVQAYALRSVGCVPVGPRGVLYLHDPERPGRFSAEHRYRLTALCRIAAPFLAHPTHHAVRPFEPVPGIVGDSPPMHELAAGIRAFAPMPWPALILGESGTGKELVARALHELSSRSRRPFVAVNCGAIPENLAESTLFGHERGAFTGADRRHEGFVERARGGTLFLDEIGELPSALQVKLLRLLQEGTFERVGGSTEIRFSGRVVAASLRPLDDQDARGTFRPDLYYRLASCVLRTPALRDRPGDVPALAAYLLERALDEIRDAPRLTLSPRAVRALQIRTWPGNVRELENVLRRAIARAMAARADAIGPEHLGEPVLGAGDESFLDDQTLEAATDAFQRRLVEAALAACDGNRTRAAERLGVSRQWLHRLLARWEGS